MGGQSVNISLEGTQFNPNWHNIHLGSNQGLDTI